MRAWVRAENVRNHDDAPLAEKHDPDYGADAAYPLSELAEKLRGYLVGRSVLFYGIGHPKHDGTIRTAPFWAYRSRPLA